MSGSSPAGRGNDSAINGIAQKNDNKAIGSRPLIMKFSTSLFP
jgi:hypothetical protein